MLTKKIMNWISTKEKLPPTYRNVMVCREIRMRCIDPPILVHDIGMLEGKEPSDRWSLCSQMYSPIPVEPTLSSNIVTHWMELPELQKQEE